MQPDELANHPDRPLLVDGDIEAVLILRSPDRPGVEEARVGRQFQDEHVRWPPGPGHVLDAGVGVEVHRADEVAG